MKKYCLLVLAGGFFAASLTLIAQEKKETQREIDVGVFSDARYPKNNYFEAKIDRHISRINAQGLKVEKVGADIFLAANKIKRDSFKRILILEYYIFNPEIYSGMEDYVKNGGFLITDSIMYYIDVNNNFVYDKDIDEEVESTERLHGIVAHSSVKLENITARVECPLTKGFEKDKAYECSLYARDAKNVNATVVMTSTAFRKNQQTPVKEMPVLAFKNLGNGAFIYLAIPDNDEIFRNCFSNEALEWLTNN